MKKILTIFFAMCVLCGCTSDMEDATGSIYGVVSYSNSAEPVKGVGVELYNARSMSLLLRTTTSDDGSYSFEEITSGDYYLQVVSEGYKTASYSVSVEPGRQARADMQLVEKTIDISVSTLAVSNVAGAGATFNGSYKVSYFNDAPTECGFIYSTSSKPKVEGTKVVAEKVTGIENNFSASVSGLTPGTWYVQAYATRKKGEYDDGTAYGDVVSFEISGDPQVSTLDITNITNVSATLNGYVEYAGDPKYTEKGFIYSKSYTVPTIDDPSDATTKMPVSGSANEFSVVIDGLEINKTYYVRAYITNQNVTTYGDVKTFKINPKYYVLSEEGLMVQADDINSDKYTRWDVAYAMCENSTVGGFDDWRMPTIQELIILYLHKDEIGNFKDSYYWSADKVYSDDNYYKCLSFEDGSLIGYYYTKEWRVRAVRTIK